MAIAVKFENVGFSYEGSKKNVIDGVSFEIEEGDFVALVGRNAAGKSTIAKLVNGLIAPSSGKITVLGMDALDEKNSFEIRKKVGIVFQNPDNQTVATIVEDDVAFGPENIGIPREEIGERIRFALQSTGTEGFRHSAASNLSGGQKQRVAIAGVLAMKPSILVLDESTSMLDPKGRREVMGVVKKLNAEGMTVVVITHYMDEVTDCNTVLVCGNGKILKTGTPREIFSDTEILKEAGLELPVPAKIAAALKKNGVDVGTPLTKEELLKNICESLQKI